MMKYLSITFLLISFGNVNGQPLSGPETLRNYSTAQKRLLVINTAQFANFITQNSLDQDSIMTIACRITGMPFLLPYTEGLGDAPSPGRDLINAGRINDAIALVTSLQNEEKIQLLIEIGIWYLYQPGLHKADLNYAEYYITSARKLCIGTKYLALDKECQFLNAELNYQRGNIPTTKFVLNQLLIAGQQERNNRVIARAYNQFGLILPTGDSMKIRYYRKSLELYNQLPIKEKIIEVLVNISWCEVREDVNLTENDLRQVLSLMQQANFKHVMYTQNMLAYALVAQIKYIDALGFANMGMENLKWSGLDAVAGSFYYRTGAIYLSLGKNAEALVWFKKALNTGTNDTHIFWYKSLFFSTSVLQSLNRPRESVSLLDTITAKFPPITLWEKMQVLSVRGECYEKLNQPELADKYYLSLLKLANDNPSADPRGELSDTYLSIAGFYVSKKDLQKARIFLKQGLVNVNTEDPYTKKMKYSLASRIDSLEGNYKSALKNYILYKLNFDSSTSVEQQKKLEELTILYAAEKKDRDIKLLKQQGIVQQIELKQNKLIRDIMIGGSVMLLIFMGLLYNRFRLKQRINKQLEFQQQEIAQKNASLQNLVEQKEWLLKEVHHRVKNNLQIIISLLNTQSNYLDSDAAIKAIRESQQRMSAISLIHQKLYKTDNAALININEYVHELVEHIRNSFSGASGIVFELDIIDRHIDVEQAVPLGLILNEAVSNAVKYAFPGLLSGRVSISITHSSVNDDYLLTVADNGVGLPQNTDISKKVSFGIRLMQGLSKQLGGSFKIETDKGVKIKVSFEGSKMVRVFKKQDTNETVA